MYNIVVSKQKINYSEIITIPIPTSKSISNRLLIIRYLSNKKADIENLSDSGDTLLLNEIISEIENGKNNSFFCKNAGTTTRFLIALLSITKGVWRVSADKRMQQRPVFDLLRILQELGAKISYQSKENPFPIIINGRVLTSKKIFKIEKHLTSQIISALLLISPHIKNGLTLQLNQNQVSFSYIKQTIALANHFGAKIEIRDNTIISQEAVYEFCKTRVGKDFSSLCFVLLFVCVGKLKDVVIEDIKPDCLQGDFKAIEIFKDFGLDADFKNGNLMLSYNSLLFYGNNTFIYDLKDTPDIFLPLTVCMYCKGVGGKIFGLSSQRKKESDRLENITRELNKLGKRCFVGDDTLIIESGKIHAGTKPQFNSYNDHRIVMSLSVVAMVCENIYFDNVYCVEKSWTSFFCDVSKLIDFRPIN